MLDVIGRAELKVGPEGAGQNKGQRRQTQPGRQATPERERDQTRVQDLVVQRHNWQAGLAQPATLQGPGAFEGTRHFAPHEAIDGLSHARRGRIRWCGHISVMSAVVFNVKVSIAGGGQNQLGQPALELGLLVAQLMAQIDAKAAHRTGNEHHRQHTVPRQFMAGDKPDAKNKGQPQNGQQGISDAAVEQVGIERRHGRLGRVAAVAAQEVIDQGHNTVKKDHRQPQAAWVAAPKQQGGTQGHRGRDQQTHQPGITFSVHIRALSRLLEHIDGHCCLLNFGPVWPTWPLANTVASGMRSS